MDPQDEIAVVERRLREGGHRWTQQRRRIAEVVFATHEHFNAEELLAMCRKVDSRVSRATVYRMIAAMEAVGVVESLDAGDGGRRFEHVLGHEHHDHMICRSCGRIVEFTDAKLERQKAEIAHRMGFTMLSHELKLVVECNDLACPGRRSGPRR